MNNEMIDELLSSIPETGYSPTDHQFELVESLVQQLSAENICDAIFRRYQPGSHDRHVIAMVFSMLIWHSKEHNVAVSRFMSNWIHSSDPVKVGVAISRALDWFPFGTVRSTLNGVKSLSRQFPQFKDDCEYWNSAAQKELYLYKREGITSP